MTLAEFVSVLEGRGFKPVAAGDDWKSCCPAHDDRNPSLSVSAGDDGRVLVKCWAGCTAEAITGALNLKVADLFPGPLQKAKAAGAGPKRVKPKLGPIVATYDYEDAEGNVIAQKTRHDPKDFRWRRPDGNDGWDWGRGGLEIPVYRLPLVLRLASAGKLILIVEGEKDCGSLRGHKLAATTAPDGGTSGPPGKKWLPHHTAALAGADAVIIPDRDEPDPKTGKRTGWEFAQFVAASIHGTAKRVRLVELPATLNGRPVKDASDFFEAGGTAEQLLDLVSAAPDWTPPADAPPDNEDTTAADPDAPAARPITSFGLPPDDDPNELIRYRFLCRGGGALFYGPTGIGKSVLLTQQAINWALGRDCLGFAPARPLRSLIIQAENDDGDIGEMVQGMKRRLNLSPEEQAAVAGSVFVVQVDSLAGEDFCDRALVPLISQHHPDIVFLDPANAYHGGDASKQPDVSRFLRQQLNPVLHQYRCAAIIAHHTNKPPGSGNEKPDWKGSDLAYLGSGSAEWANWPRGVYGLISIGSPTVFRLVLGKRGSRLRWPGDDDQLRFERMIAYDREPGVLCWREADPEEANLRNQGGNGVMPPKTVLDLLAHIPPTGTIGLNTLKKRTADAGFKSRDIAGLIEEARDSGRVFEHSKPRPGTHPEIRYGRQPAGEADLLGEAPPVAPPRRRRKGRK